MSYVHLTSCAILRNFFSVYFFYFLLFFILFFICLLLHRWVLDKGGGFIDKRDFESEPAIAYIFLVAPDSIFCFIIYCLLYWLRYHIGGFGKRTNEQAGQMKQATKRLQRDGHN